MYTSRGREAGSGITSESFNGNANYVQFSNGFKMQYGKSTSSNEAITFPVAFKNTPFLFSKSNFSNVTEQGCTVASANQDWLAIGV